MKIALISKSDIGGGAAKATYRLHKGIREAGESSSMIVMQKLTSERDIILIRDKITRGTLSYWHNIQDYISSHRTEISNTLFSLAYPGMDISRVPQVHAADVVNLHWIAGFYQSPMTIRKLLDLGKPVVWTLHDQWAFTGGCHYTAGCLQYEDACRSCPQLTDDLFGLPERVLLDKVELFHAAPLTIVTPSVWLKDSAKRSRLFRDVRIEVIPNSLETDVFTPQDKVAAKMRLGISRDMITLLFGAENGREKRKGFRELIEAVLFCRSDRVFKALLNEGKIRLLAFGYQGDELSETGLPVHRLGYINSDHELAGIYSAADIFILPSLEDNLPNMMLEAMSCGTAVVAFEIGGMKDVIRDDVTGKIVCPFSTKELGKAILDLIINRQKTWTMGTRSRQVVEERFRLDVQAGRYLDLYKEILKASGNGIRITNYTRAFYTSHTEYLLEADLSTGRHFQSIEESVRRRLAKSTIERLPTRIQRGLRTVYRRVYNSLPNKVRGLISAGAGALKQYLS